LRSVGRLSASLHGGDGVNVVKTILASFAHEPNPDHVRAWKGCTVPQAVAFRPERPDGPPFQ
jgi:hypothetical protein